MKLVDIIIPVYKNAEATLSKALASIMMQTALDKVKITVIDDASGEIETYKRLIDKFNFLPDVEIVLISMKENSGPGACRQVGIHTTSLPYIMFVDADDQLASKYSVQFLLSAMEANTFHVVLSDFMEEIHNENEEAGCQVFEHKHDMTWMFSKMYRRTALIEKGISFSPSPKCSYANEDSGFNTLFSLLTSEQDIGYIAYSTYIWSGRADSTTRANGCEYTFNKGFIGFVENQMYALHKAIPSPYLVKEKLDYQILTAFLTCYKTVAQCMCSEQHKGEYHKQCIYYARKFYEEFYFYIVPLLYDGNAVMDVINRLVQPYIMQQYTVFDFIMAVAPKLPIDEIRKSHLKGMGGK